MHDKKSRDKSRNFHIPCIIDIFFFFKCQAKKKQLLNHQKLLRQESDSLYYSLAFLETVTHKLDSFSSLSFQQLSGTVSLLNMIKQRQQN